MNPLALPFPQTLIMSIGWALVHSLWQGTAIAALLWFSLRAFPGTSSHGRYLIACAAMSAVLISAISTGAYHAQNRHVPIASAVFPAIGLDSLQTFTNPDVSAPSPSIASLSDGSALTRAAEGWLSWVVSAWLVGLVVVSVRLFGGWVALRRMCHRGWAPADTRLQQRASVLAKALGLRRAVRVLESNLAAAPMIVGWIRPIILMPVVSVTGLSTGQLEAVLAHELAHVRRHDYLVNLLQCVVETLLFYHPAVWWIGRVIRQERERCCDDLAVQVSGDRVDYARALLVLAESAASYPNKLAPAAHGGDLSSRVRRLMGAETQSPAGRGSAGLWAALASLCLVAVFVVGVRADNKSELKDEPVNAVTTEAAADPKSPDTDTQKQQRIIEIPYQKLIDGDPAYNIVIRPGDVIRIPQAGPAGGFVYIAGEVNRSGAYNIPGHNDLTLKQLIVSAGGIDPDAPPRYATLIRRVSPDGEEISHFSLDDLFDGWERDAFLAPNDVVNITSKSGYVGSEAAKQRRELREQLPRHKEEIQNLREQQEVLVHDFNEGHRVVERVKSRIKAIQEEIARIESQLDGSMKQTGAQSIIPAPEPTPTSAMINFERVSIRMSDGDNDKAGDEVTIVFRNTDTDLGLLLVIKRLGQELTLALPELESMSFTGATLSHTKDTQHKKTDGRPSKGDYQIILSNDAYTFVSLDAGKLSTHNMGWHEMSLLDALAQAGGVPEGTKVIQVIRHPSNP